MNHPAVMGYLASGSILATLGLSDLPGWVAIITALSALFGLSALRATAYAWRGERDAEKAKADRLELDLAAEIAAHGKTLHRAEAAEKKPDVEKLWELMKAHDTRMAGLAADTTRVLNELTSTLQANTHALTVWATQQAQNFDAK